MQTQVKHSPDVPEIVLGHLDHLALLALADGVGGPLAKAADALLGELDRASVVPQQNLPQDVVRMGSLVTFDTVDGHSRTFRLVVPADANIDDARVSVLTPIGTALIGLRAGQSIPWTSRDGQQQMLVVRKVVQERAQ